MKLIARHVEKFCQERIRPELFAWLKWDVVNSNAQNMEALWLPTELQNVPREMYLLILKLIADSGLCVFPS